MGNSSPISWEDVTFLWHGDSAFICTLWFVGFFTNTNLHELTTNLPKCKLVTQCQESVLVTGLQIQPLN